MDSPDPILLVSSVLMGVAVFLAVRWGAPLWDALAQRQLADLTPRMQQLSLDTRRLPALLRWWGLSMAATFLVCLLVLHIPLIGAVAVYVIYIMPRTILEMWIGRRRALLRDQMVGASVLLANATRAGLSLAQGLEAVGNESPEPLASEFRRLVREYQRGRPLGEALRDAKSRLNLDGFTLLVNAVLSSLERGGKVTEALERISRSLQENQRLERKLDADTASGRKVVVLLTVFPFGFLIVFYLLAPETVGLLFTTLLGEIVVVIIAVLVFASVKWAQRILTVDI
jgi:tight adherence protein B